MEKKEDKHSTMVSVICTVRNEEDSIDDLLQALLNQTFSPSEIIIVDGGSTDRTIEKVRFWQEKTSKVRLIEERGATIGRGRNLGISQSANEIIAVTDAGAKPKIDWIENLLKRLLPDVDVVSGFYVPDARTRFEWIVGRLTFPRLENVNEKTFLPSSRSVCFRKSCWERVGGYPENSNTAEDTVFDLKLAEAGCRFKFAGDAIVMWRCRSSYKGIFKQWYGYAKGDGKLGTVMDPRYGRRHYLKVLIEGYGTIALFLSTIPFNPLLVFAPILIPISYLFGYYLFKRQGKLIYYETNYPLYLIEGPLLIGTIHLAQFLGIHAGSISKK